MGTGTMTPTELIRAAKWCEERARAFTGTQDTTAAELRSAAVEPYTKNQRLIGSPI